VRCQCRLEEKSEKEAKKRQIKGLREKGDALYFFNLRFLLASYTADYIRSKESGFIHYFTLGVLYECIGRGDLCVRIRGDVDHWKIYIRRRCWLHKV
jgi:hypothetical protein